MRFMRALQALDSQTSVATHSANLPRSSRPSNGLASSQVTRAHGESEAVGLSNVDVRRLSRLTSPLTAESFSARTVVLAEGLSDKRALEALAARRRRNLDAERISIVPVGGATNIGRFLELFGPQGLDVRLAGLCDAAEEGAFRRGLERAGLGSNLTRADMERLGFYVYVVDLEDELIRSLGAAAVEEVMGAQGDLGSFRTLQKQPAWQGRPTEEQLRRFMGSGGSRKIRYAQLLIDALDLGHVPRPLERVLAHA
jgi:predicted ATP-dependent endonuclease of OLD family